MHGQGSLSFFKAFEEEGSTKNSDLHSIKNIPNRKYILLFDQQYVTIMKIKKIVLKQYQTFD